MITTGEKVPNDRLKNQLNDLEVILHQLTVLDRADGPEQLNTAIDELLRCMGDYTHAERTYLFAYLSESGIYRNISEWCSKGGRYAPNRQSPVGFLHRYARLARNLPRRRHDHHS